MKTENTFDASDGWLLLTLSCFWFRRLRAADILSIGDTLHQRIFRLDELNDGFSRLESEGYVAVRGKRIKLLAPAKKFLKQNRRRKEELPEENERVMELFRTMPLTKPCEYKEYFTEKAFLDGLHQKSYD